MVKKIALVLSGCGHRDGSEITEAISSWIALTELGVQVEAFAPDIQFSVTDPLTGISTKEVRRVLTESARVVRGHVQNLTQLHPENHEAVVFPGGFGAALNLCNWALKGSQCSVHPEVDRVIQGFYSAEKPIGAICIAPALIARVLGSHGITVTIGEDPETASEIKKTGALHENCRVDDFVTDREHRIVTTPAYMYDDATPFQVFTGIRKAIRELVEMA